MLLILVYMIYKDSVVILKNSLVLRNLKVRDLLQIITIILIIYIMIIEYKNGLLNIHAVKIKGGLFNETVVSEFIKSLGFSKKIAGDGLKSFYLFLKNDIENGNVTNGIINNDKIYCLYTK